MSNVNQSIVSYSITTLAGVTTESYLASPERSIVLKMSLLLLPNTVIESVTFCKLTDHPGAAPTIESNKHQNLNSGHKSRQKNIISLTKQITNVKYQQAQ